MIVTACATAVTAVLPVVSQMCCHPSHHCDRGAACHVADTLPPMPPPQPWCCLSCCRHAACHAVTVTLLRALRPDVGGWVTLSPRYWTGVPSGGGRAPYSAVLDKDLSWSSKLARCLSRQYKRMCAKADTSQRRVSKW